MLIVGVITKALKMSFNVIVKVRNNYAKKSGGGVSWLRTIVWSLYNEALFFIEKQFKGKSSRREYKLWMIVFKAKNCLRTSKGFLVEVCELTEYMEANCFFNSVSWKSETAVR